MFSHSKQWQQARSLKLKRSFGERGEIATTLTLIGVTVMAIGAIVGANLTRNQDIRSKAADFGTAVLQCDSGTNPYKSNTITITNNTDKTIPEIDSNVFRCKYTGEVREGYYKCEDNCDGDGPDCQEGFWDPGASLLIQNLAPGQSITRTIEVGPCEIMQLDAYNKDVYQDDSPYECTNVRSSNTVPAGNRWPGGLGFAIQANSNCTQPFNQPSGSTPLPVKDMSPQQPQPTQPQTQPTQCSNEKGSCVSSPNDCQGSGVQNTLGLGCNGNTPYCCKPKGPTPVPNTSQCSSASLTSCSISCSGVGTCTCINAQAVCVTPTPVPASCKGTFGNSASCMSQSCSAIPGYENKGRMDCASGQNCCAPKTASQTPVCTTGINITNVANICRGNHEEVPGVPGCYRCKETTSTLPLQGPVSSPLSLQQISGKRGFDMESASDGYVFFEGQGQLYAVPYMLQENEQNLFRVL